MHPYLQAWRSAEQQIGGVLRTAGGGLTASAELHLIRGDRHVVARGHFSAGFSSTRVTAALPAAEGLRLRVRERRVRPPVRRGIKTVRVGDPGFAEEFRVDCNDPALASLWLSASVQRAFAAADPARRYELAIEGEQISALGPGRFESDPEVLAGVFEAVIALLDRGAELDREWRQLGASLGGRTVGSWGTSGEPSIALIRSGAEVWLDSYLGPLGGVRGDDALFTRAHCRRRCQSRPDGFAVLGAGEPRVRVDVVGDLREAQMPALEPDYRIFATAFAPLADRFSPERALRLRRTAPALVVGDDEQVTLWLRGRVTAPDRLLFAVELARELAVEIELGSGGPYR